MGEFVPHTRVPAARDVPIDSDPVLHEAIRRLEQIVGYCTAGTTRQQDRDMVSMATTGHWSPK